MSQSPILLNLRNALHSNLTYPVDLDKDQNFFVIQDESIDPNRFIDSKNAIHLRSHSKNNLKEEGEICTEDRVKYKGSNPVKSMELEDIDSSPNSPIQICEEHQNSFEAAQDRTPDLDSTMSMNIINPTNLFPSETNNHNGDNMDPLKAQFDEDPLFLLTGGDFADFYMNDTFVSF